MPPNPPIPPDIQITFVAPLGLADTDNIYAQEPFAGRIAWLAERFQNVTEDDVRSVVSRLAKEWYKKAGINNPGRYTTERFKQDLLTEGNLQGMHPLSSRQVWQVLDLFQRQLPFWHE